MENISVKNLIDFRRKTDPYKKIFAQTLKSKKIKEDKDGGGNYWISAVSALSNCFKTDDLQPILEKIETLRDKRNETEYPRTKVMYQRNIDILKNYVDHDLKEWRPSKKMTILKKDRNSSVIKIKGFFIDVTLSHAFTFQKKLGNEIGAIWFIPKLNGLTPEELGLYSESMFNLLKYHYSPKNYVLNSQYCIAVDVVNNIQVSYSQLEKKELPLILTPTLEELRKLL